MHDKRTGCETLYDISWTTASTDLGIESRARDAALPNARGFLHPGASYDLHDLISHLSKPGGAWKRSRCMKCESQASVPKRRC